MRNWIAFGALLLPISLAGCVSRPVVVYAAPPPPAALADANRQGYNAGVEAAQRDIAEGGRPRVERHPRFRNPPVPPPFIPDYRHGFVAGYDRVIRGGAPAPGY
jgi:hypothetical protein